MNTPIETLKIQRDRHLGEAKMYQERAIKELDKMTEHFNMSKEYGLAIDELKKLED
ncbi:hypothetical protein AAK938_01400 [Aerococcaceae bacterium 50-4]